MMQHLCQSLIAMYCNSVHVSKSLIVVILFLVINELGDDASVSELIAIGQALTTTHSNCSYNTVTNAKLLQLLYKL